MTDILLQTVKEFFKKNYSAGRPLLLGFSGGPDSLALLHLILQCKSFFPDLDLHLAHVDHGWRPESAAQAGQLRGLAEKLTLPFYQHTLTASRAEDANAEAKARAARLDFFKALYEKGRFQALILAHQKDDRSETVLKKIFEGANLGALGGMQPASSLAGINIWRPLLGTSKSEILKWLQGNNLTAIDDSSNRDLKFLRARLRQGILPQLADAFGKEISNNLCVLADSAQELKHYLAKKIAPFFAGICRGPFGSYIDLNPFYPIEPFELRAFLKTFCEQRELGLSRDNLSVLERMILTKVAGKRVVLKNNLSTIMVDRGYIFLIEGPLPNFQGRGALISNTIFQDGWRWNIQCEPTCDFRPPSSWTTWWAGRAEVVLPQGEYEMASPGSHTPFPRSFPIKKWWTSHSVPAFLRCTLPLIVHQGQVVHEFLTGKSFISCSRPAQLVSIEVIDRDFSSKNTVNVI